MSNSSNCVVNELHVTSRTIDEVIGGHTFSIISYFLLVKVKSHFTYYSHHNFNIIYLCIDSQHIHCIHRQKNGSLRMCWKTHYFID